MKSRGVILVCVLLLVLTNGALSQQLMPTSSLCTNKVSEHQCDQLLAERYDDNIYRMCMFPQNMINCCEFCVSGLTCQGDNTTKNGIVDMTVKFKYLMVNCTDAIQPDQCTHVQNLQYGRDVQAMCNDTQYADMCCTYCQKGMDFKWNQLLIDEWLNHPLDLFDHLPGLGGYLGNDFPAGGKFGNYGNSLGLYKSGLKPANINKAIFDHRNAFFGNGIWSKLNGYNNYQRSKLREFPVPESLGSRRKSKQFGQVYKSDRKPWKRSNVKSKQLERKSGRVWRERGKENQCEDRIGEDVCRQIMMNENFDHSGMPHIFCSNPHNMLGCCKFCKAMNEKGLDNRKKRALAFQGKIPYPVEDETPCRDDKLSSGACTVIHQTMFQGSARRMCISVHYGNVCCDYCRNTLKR